MLGVKSGWANMIIEVTELYDMQIFTPKGDYLGVVEQIILDLNSSKVYGLALGQTNPKLVEDSRPITIPFRWIRDVTEVIILRYFPGRVKVQRKEHWKARKLRVVKRGWGEAGVARREWHY